MWKKNVKELFQHSNTQHADHSSFQSDVWRLRWQLETFWWLDETAWGRYRKYHKIFSSLPYLRDRHNRFEFNYMIDPATTAWFSWKSKVTFLSTTDAQLFKLPKTKFGWKIHKFTKNHNQFSSIDVCMARRDGTVFKLLHNISPNRKRTSIAKEQRDDAWLRWWVEHATIWLLAFFSSLH